MQVNLKYITPYRKYIFIQINAFKTLMRLIVHWHKANFSEYFCFRII